MLTFSLVKEYVTSLFRGTESKIKVIRIVMETAIGPMLYFVRNEIKQNMKASVHNTVKIIAPIPAPSITIFILNIKINHVSILNNKYKK